jgi:23S rRNA (uridine2552-2'-O)-methyltransferase
MKKARHKGNQWEDHYARRAREEKWLARSVYKLEEMDRKLRLIRKGNRILDLGCFPGSWSQYGIKKVGPHGEVVGVDLKEPNRLSAPNFIFIRSDVFDLDPARLRGEIGLRQAVLSDMAPKTTGIPLADVSRSVRLAEKALELALAVLEAKGRFLCKVFEAGELADFRNECSRYFDQVRTIRPSAVRKGSREVYLAGLGFLGPPEVETG